MSNVKDIRRQDVMITTSDGQDRKLRFTMNAFAELELKYDSIEKAIAKMEEGSILAIRYILWLGLNAEDPELTEQEVGNLIEIRDFPTLMEQLTSAMGFDLPAQPEEANPN